MHLQVVVKASKLCNLRCTYCYETPWLDQPARISPDRISIIYDRIGQILTASTASKKQVDFFWQGGEALMLPPSFWLEAYERQEYLRSLGDVTVRNEIQTNATLVTSKHLDVFQSRYSIGISFDVINDFRLTVRGRPTADTVQSAIAAITDAGIPISGCVAVVSRANIGHASQVADFFVSRKLSFRLLNIYTGLDLLPQIAEAAVTWREYIDFCVDIFNQPGVREAMADGLIIEPISTAIEMGSRRNGGGMQQSVSAADEWVLVIDTDGSLYSAGDLYNREFCYGNIFEDGLENLFFSEGRKRRITRSAQRLEKICERCSLYRNGCDGAYVAHCTPEEAEAFEDMGSCYFGAVERRLTDGLLCTSG